MLKEDIRTALYLSPKDSSYSLKSLECLKKCMCAWSQLTFLTAFSSKSYQTVASVTVYTIYTRPAVGTRVVDTFVDVCT